MGEDRRKFGRFAISSLGQIFIKRESRDDDLFLVDIGRGGIGMRTRTNIPLNSDVAIRFPYFDDEGEVHLAVLDGRVVWSVEESGMTRMGSKLAEAIRDDAKDSLGELLNRMEQSQ